MDRALAPRSSLRCPCAGAFIVRTRTAKVSLPSALGAELGGRATAILALVKRLGPIKAQEFLKELADPITMRTL